MSDLMSELQIKPHEFTRSAKYLIFLGMHGINQVNEVYYYM
ncbi:MAG: hypothetical protein ABJI95_03435 [Paracoccaceae bacterium]